MCHHVRAAAMRIDRPVFNWTLAWFFVAIEPASECFTVEQQEPTLLLFLFCQLIVSRDFLGKSIQHTRQAEDQRTEFGSNVHNGEIYFQLSVH